MVIRDVQADIAQAMLSPPSGSNTVMQLNMGEGKSSVIVPMIASTIANGEKLARVVVLTPLLREMFNLLTSRLGNICGRRIFHLPFSRNVEVYRSNIESIREIYEEVCSTIDQYPPYFYFLICTNISFSVSKTGVSFSLGLKIYSPSN